MSATKKVYVKVNADFLEEGEVRPRKIIWTDGAEYEITRVRYMEKAASVAVGGCGIKYTVIVEGREKYIFRDGDRWFVEAV